MRRSLIVYLRVRVRRSNSTCICLSPPNHNRASDRSYGRRPGAGFDIDSDEVHYPTRPMDKDKAEQELAINIKKATSTEETAPKEKHVRSTCAVL